ncbi:MAG: MarR family winged helix-turn-helix transcriptional regulator [Candidatus Dormibacteria bacterium]
MSLAPPPAPGNDDADSTRRALDALVQLLASFEALDLRRFGDLGLTLSQLRVLHLLRDQPASCGHLAEHLGITASTATALIDRLVRRGLIERRPRPGDRRVTDLALSDAARSLIEAAAARKGGEVRAAVEDLAPADRQRLAVLLDHLAARVQSAEARVAGADAAAGPVPDPAQIGARSASPAGVAG